MTGNLTQNGGMVVLQGNSFVNGNLTMQGGSLSISNSTVGNNLQIQGGGYFSIGPAVSIGWDGGETSVQTMLTAVLDGRSL